MLCELVGLRWCGGLPRRWNAIKPSGFIGVAALPRRWNVIKPSGFIGAAALECYVNLSDFVGAAALPRRRSCHTVTEFSVRGIKKLFSVMLEKSILA